MSKRLDFDREDVLRAIEGSGGIMSAVASSLECAWHTAKKYVNKWESTKRAFEAENERTLDKAESLIERNITLGLRMQQESKQPVDSGDAKWLLSRKGKARGYTERHEHQHEGTGKDGELVIRVVYGDDGTKSQATQTA